jgi:hypothetical protein
MLWMSHKIESALCPYRLTRKNGSLSGRVVRFGL